MKGFVKAMAVAALAVVSMAGSASQAAITYYHNDIAGSPLVATNEAGQVVWRESYRPYGERTVNAAAANANKVWFTSRRQDDSGLVYMGARYYDPVAGRFISTDPAGLDEMNLHSFNRYAYANNNPYRYVDPDGRQAFPFTAIAPPPGAQTPSPPSVRGKPSEQDQVRALEGSWQGGFTNDQLRFILGGFTGLLADRLSSLIFNSNPYSGPVDTPVVVVDSKGNAIPVGKGEQVTSSPDGNYQQVRDREGRQTGVRLDRGGHKGQSDPAAQAPHGHVPGATKPDGNPHLPINE